ncbi:unnamed protein product [Protopolystoma xenopodis]|uniref:Uncharacterized protein n=1 Tax=Protopolystoma xenopodis TaxID=117903 RepID=A0A3S5BF03_9PLAT|nr:unnamed protein product [Protopolystoma xenopodis]
MLTLFILLAVTVSSQCHADFIHKRILCVLNAPFKRRYCRRLVDNQARLRRRHRPFTRMPKRTVTNKIFLTGGWWYDLKWRQRIAITLFFALLLTGISLFCIAFFHDHYYTVNLQLHSTFDSNVRRIQRVDFPFMVCCTTSGTSYCAESRPLGTRLATGFTRDLSS